MSVESGEATLSFLKVQMLIISNHLPTLWCGLHYRWWAPLLSVSVSPVVSVPALSPPPPIILLLLPIILWPHRVTCSLLLPKGLCSYWNIHPLLSPRLMSLTPSDLCSMRPALDTLSFVFLLQEYKLCKGRDFCLFHSLTRTMPGIFWVLIHICKRNKCPAFILVLVPSG